MHILKSLMLCFWLSDQWVTWSISYWPIVSTVLQGPFCLQAIEDKDLENREVLKAVMKQVDRSFTIIFIIEMLIKQSAYGFKKYFTDAWCWLDFVIVAVCIHSHIDRTIEITDFYLSWLSYWYKLVKMLSVCLSVCLDVNQGGTNRNRCTQRLVILHMTTNQWTAIAHQKLGQSGLLYASKSSTEKKWTWIGIFKPAEPRSPWDDCLF